jgi:dipeptidyl-peptidase 9
MEYIGRAGWISNSKCFYLQLVDRLQERVEWRKFDIEQDCVTGATVIKEEEPEKIGKTIFSDNSKYWINVRDNFVFLSDGSLICSRESDSDGYAQLYMIHTDQDPKQLTFGEFCVVGNKIWVDESRKSVFYLCNKDIENHLFTCSYESPSLALQLTPDGCDHNVSLSIDFGVFAMTFSNVSTTAKTRFFDIDLEKKSISLLSELKPSSLLNEKDSVSVDLISFNTNDGVKLFGAIVKPPNYDGKALPTVIYAYGGPHVQLVRNHNALARNPVVRVLASSGYIVGVVDNRGSFNRGLAFEGLLKHKMGQVEVQDQVSMVNYLVSNGYTEPNRVAVTGWSYGGYLTLMCLSQRPDVFKVSENFLKFFLHFVFIDWNIRCSCDILGSI